MNMECYSYFIVIFMYCYFTEYGFVSTYTFNMVILVSTNHYDFYVYQVMRNALLVCLHREKLGSSDPNRRKLSCTLTGSVPIVVATHLKRWNQFNLPWYHHICTSINILNCSVPSACWSFNLHCALLHASLLCEL